MNSLQKIVVVSPITRELLGKIKTASNEKGRRETLGGIVERLVENEYERINQEG